MHVCIYAVKYNNNDLCWKLIFVTKRAKVARNSANISLRRTILTILAQPLVVTSPAFWTLANPTLRPRGGPL